MNPHKSKSILLPLHKNRLVTILNLTLFGIGLMWVANMVFAATTVAPTAKSTAAKSQSSDDVLKWLQMTGTKSVSDVKEEKDQKASKETSLKTSASAASGANASTSTHSRPVVAEKAIEHSAPETPPLVSPTPEPVVTVAAAPSSALSLPPEAQIPVATAVATPVEPEVKVLSRAQPDFPREAENRGITKGKVTARLYIGMDGAVTRVEIVEANPKRVFDSAVTYAAMRWKFSPLPSPNATEVTFNFKMTD